MNDCKEDLRQLVSEAMRLTFKRKKDLGNLRLRVEVLKCELASGLSRGKLPGMTPFLKASPARGESNTKHDLCNMHHGRSRTGRKVVSSQRYAHMPSSFEEAEPVVSNPRGPQSTHSY